MTQVREVWTPKRMAASGILANISECVSGFFCTTGGTIQITAGTAAGGADIVSSFTGVAGVYYPFPMRLYSGAYATLGGGAIGTFFVGK